MRDFLTCAACRLDDDERSVVSLVDDEEHDGPVTHFWDEDGDAHIHDLSGTYSHYQCSRGHSWEDWEPLYLCWCEDDRIPSWRDCARPAS